MRSSWCTTRSSCCDEVEEGRPVAGVVEAEAAHSGLGVVDMGEEHVGQARPDQVLEVELAVVGAAGSDLAEALVEAVEPGRRLAGPRGGLPDGEGALDALEGVDALAE